MRVPIKAHHNIITDETTFEYADVPGEVVTDTFQKLYEKHLRQQKFEKGAEHQYDTGRRA